MKRALRIVALLIAIAALVVWMATGANRGFTKRTIEVRTLDEITGIEGIENRKAFIPGVDFLGSALIGAGLLFGASFFFRKKQTNK